MSTKRITATSLIEQMGLTEREILQRLHQFDFTEKSSEILRSAAKPISIHIPEIIENFYEIQLEDKEIATIIGDSDTLSRLKGSLSVYVSQLFSGNYNLAYANTRLRIGKVHKRMGVTPKLYISTLSHLQGLLDRHIQEIYSGDHCQDVLSALHKILLFDSQLVFEAYIDSFLTEMEAAEQEVANYAEKLEIKVNTMTRQLHDLSTKDSLTGLYNHRSVFEYLQREISISKRYDLPLCLAYFDLNKFKAVNDTHGHATGDQVLKSVGASILKIIRAVDIPCRYGGDEFCIIMPRTTLVESRLVLERLAVEFNTHENYGVSFSTGIVQTPIGEVVSGEDLIKQADKKMYAAKAKSKESPGHQIEM